MPRRKTGRTKLLQVRVTPEQYEKLEMYARLRETNVTEIVRPRITALLAEIAAGQVNNPQQAA